MKRSLWVYLLAALLATSTWLVAQHHPSESSPAALVAVPAPPPTRSDNVKETLHGVELVDPYRWLEDQWSPETRAWIEAQNKYTDSVIGHLPGREALEKRLGELLRVESIGTPRARAGRYFFSKRAADQDLFIVYVRQGLDGRDEVLIDPHPLSPDHTTSVNLLDVSDDGSLVVYGIREGGQDEVSLRFREVATRKDLPDVFPKARYGSPTLAPDKKGFYYVKWTRTGPRVYFHVMGADPAGDKVLFGEGYGPEKIIAASLSEDGRWLLITVLYGSAADKTELYLMDTAKPGAVTTVVNDIPARFSGAIGGDTLFLHTNWNAPNNRILAVDLKNPARENWREVVPEGADVLDSMALVGGRLVTEYLHNVRSRVRIFEADGKPVRDLELPALGSVGQFSGRWSGPEAFYAFSSFHMPTTIYRYDVAGGKQSVWARLKVPVDTDNFMVRQVWYESKDGTLVPMWLVHRKGVRLDGSNPTLLTGYGGFNLSLSPGFSSRAVAWVERGGVYAVPNLRGGGEFGEKWHKAGMREKKQNVFDDFIAAAEWLIESGYTSPEKLAIAGGSNGGLLVGAAMTQRPDLFGAVVCSYPLLDMVRYQKFLVARFWVPEYGSADDAEQFRYIRAYSPYHNVKPGTKYPAVLFITGDSDTRVDPLHARKMAALVQASNGGSRPALLRYDTKAGHSGGLPVSKQIEDLTDELSFLFWQLGVISPAD
ncbi:MAG TPA: prolyl oligopeptidase family serine peptidase [Candidatus Xenobia bacterium]|nr:prolyl oligopeptidase family serine peptidase [Candidatus Xenobia bacterium]